MTTQIAAAQQAEMIELLQDARNLLNQYYWGKGSSRLARTIMDKIQKVLVDTGALPSDAKERWNLEGDWAYRNGLRRVYE